VEFSEVKINPIKQAGLMVGSIAYSVFLAVVVAGCLLLEFVKFIGIAVAIIAAILLAWRLL
jgi:ABC-type multidrug transport system permease subunit